MTTPLRPRSRTAALLAGAFGLAISSLLAACTLLGPRPDASRFFILTPLHPQSSPSGGARVTSLGIGPIHLPSYLDRPEVVTRVGPNEVKPAVFDYWAGSLSRQFEAVLAENLQALVGAGRVQMYPWYKGATPDLAVEVDVIRFEASSDGRVELVARWWLRRGSQVEPLRSGETVLNGTVDGTGPAAATQALSKLLGDFSREIARAITAVRA
jgi:uncharacterized lipoprotein YmbA